MDIDGWLRGIGLAQYAEILRTNDIDGELLGRLTNDDLKDIGVASFGHRKKLLEAIAELGSAPAAGPTAPAMPTLIPTVVAPPPTSASVDAVSSVRRLISPRMALPIDRPEIIARPGRETLDPDDWSEALAISRRILDDAVAYLRDVRDRPVWKEMPPEVRASFDAPLPRKPELLAEVYREVAETVMAYPMGNVHPRFWAWYMGSSNFTGAIGDFLAAIQGSNLGGGSHAAALMDRQVVDWLKTMVGFPRSASGTLVSGGSMANIVGLAVARNVKAGVDVRELGVAAIEKSLCFYGSDQIYSCHRKAMEVLGLGNQALRRIPTDRELRMDVDALRAAIAKDRADGLAPCCVIATRARSTRAPSTTCRRLRLSPAKRISGSMSTDASVPSSPSHPGTPTGSRGSKRRICSPSIPTSGCTRHSRRVARWSGTRRLIAPRSPLRPNISSRRRAASHPESGCTNGACKPRANSGHSRSGWR